MSNLQYSDDELMRIATKRAKEKAGFLIHFVIYLAVNLFLIGIWWFTSSTSNSPDDIFPWFIFPLFGWGIGVAGHFAAVYFGQSYVENAATKELKKLRERQR